MISVIIPFYNNEKDITECLDSILKQKYRDFEVIFVNDGSMDRSAEIVKSYLPKFNNEKILYKFFEQSNKGAPAARNKGYKEAIGKYLLFSDADAILRDDMLEKMVDVLEKNKEVSYVYSSHYWGEKLFKLFPFDKEKLKKMPYIHTMSLIRKEHFPEKGWDEGIKKFQDWDLWLTILEGGSVGYFIEDALFKINPGGTMSDWVPSFAYKLFPFLPQVRKYKKAMKIIKEKHNLK